MLSVAFALFLAMGLAVPLVRAQDKVEFFPMEKVQPGLKGTGKTIFQGDKVEEFQVEILGVLKNAMAPKRDVILARLSGGPLEKTGVIAGMSGSPVYIDGKLLGAVALSFPFSKEPLAGITPIQEMTAVVPAAAAPAPPAPPKAASAVRVARIPGSGGLLRLIPESDNPYEDWLKTVGADDAQGDLGLTGMRFPIRFGGFSSDLIQSYSGFFRHLGFEPASGATLAATDEKMSAAADPAPGSMISLLLVHGDLNLDVDCTVTHRDKDHLFACGHRFLMVGPAKIPFSAARVITTVPSLASSFKLAVAGPPIGSITQDRFGAIYGVVGEKSRMIPVSIHLESTLNKTSDIHFEIVQHAFLSPFLLNLGVTSALNATERAVGPSTLELKGKIELTDGQAIDLEDVISGDFNTPGSAGLSVAFPLAQLLSTSFPDLQVERVDLTLVSSNEKRMALVEQAWSSKSEVAPGDKIEVTAVLRTPSGEAIIQKIPVNIPENVNDRMLTLIVGSGAMVNQIQTRFSPANLSLRDLQQLVQAMNKTRRNNRVYALLMAPQRSFVVQGDEYPSPPPSLVQTFLADPAVSSSITFSGMSIIGDFETKPMPVTIRGQKTLMLKVVETGN
ncbi:MAG: hypothetical protein HY508_13050 [Acidobacteria bacterium]|nr:hypothetical protein [Acidobacteriota bacterium]